MYCFKVIKLKLNILKHIVQRRNPIKSTRKSGAYSYLCYEYISTNLIFAKNVSYDPRENDVLIIIP